VKQIGPGDYQRLTSDPKADILPRWSPDGNWIAFLRHGDSGTANVMAVPAMGGREHKVGEAEPRTLDWSPDGHWLLITNRPSPDHGTGLALISFETAEIRQITSPTGSQGDWFGSFAPDGHALAFLRTRARQERLMVLALSRSLQPVGQPAEFSFPQHLTSLCWTDDSRDIIFSASDGEESTMLWRMPASGKSTRRLLSYLGNAQLPSVSRRGSRMAFARRLLYEANLWTVELDDKHQPTGRGQLAFASTRPECAPRFSPDGGKVVFQSERSGRFAIWVCETGGANCFPVSPPGPLAANPDWSPDGKWIAFNTYGASGSEIDLVGSDGGKPKFLTRGTPKFDGAMVPRWSHNGQWIYFNCGERQICRVASSGGEAQTVSGAEGWFADESPDGRWLYFSTGGEGRPGRLKRVPVSGGKAREILSQVSGRNWALTLAGVWFMAPPPTVNVGSELRYLDLATGATRTVFRTERPSSRDLPFRPTSVGSFFLKVEDHEANQT
jgi:Tol biopolymer transport system component